MPKAWRLARLFAREAAPAAALFIEHCDAARVGHAFRNRERGKMPNAGERVRVATTARWKA